MSMLTKYSNSVLARNRNFRVYFIADIFSKVADSYFLILLPFLILDFAGSNLSIGIALGLNGVCRGVASLFGGVWADRYDPQKILTWHNVAQVCGLLAVIVVMRGGGFGLVEIYIISAFFGVIDGFGAPASQAATPKIVDSKDLLEANSYSQGLEQLTAILGPVLAGLLISNYGILAGSIGSAALFLIATIMFLPIYRLNLSQGKETKQAGILHQIKDGFSVAMQNKMVRATLLLSAISNLCITGPIVVGQLLLFDQRFNVGADIYAYSGVAFSIGFLAGILIVPKLKKVQYPGRILLAVYAFYTLAFVGFAFTPNIWWTIVIYFLVGPAVAIDSTIISTMQQKTVAKSILGRIGALTAITTLAFDPLSQSLTGFLSQWSLQSMYLIFGGLLAILFMTVYATNKVLRDKFSLV